MVRPWNISSIRTRISLSALCIIFILVATVSILLLGSFKTMLRDRIFEQQYNLVTELAEQINSRLRMANAQLYMTAARVNSQNIHSKAELDHLLDDKEDVKFVFDAGLLILDVHGTVLAENLGEPALVGKNLSYREYFTETLHSGKPYLSDPFRLSVTPHSPMIAMTQPVRDDADRLIAVVIGYHTLGNGNFLTSLATKERSDGYRYIIHGPQSPVQLRQYPSNRL